MKRKGVVWTSAAGVVIILIVLVVMIALLSQGQGLLSQVFWKNIRANIQLPELEQVYFTAPDTDLTGTVADTTSTEIACDIALKIKDDFLLHGYEGTRNGWKQAGNLDPVVGKILLDIGKFRIKYDSTGSHFSYDDLMQDAKDTLAKKCMESPAPPVVQSAPEGMQGIASLATADFKTCSTPYLDEECISVMLAQLKVGETKISNLCTGLGTTGPIRAGGVLTRFGNDKCAAADGTDNCNDQSSPAYCPGGATGGDVAQNDKIIGWKAPNVALSGSTYTVADDSDFPAANGLGVAPQDCNDVKCEPEYIWTLLWNPANKAYEIEIGRLVPQIPYVVPTGTSDPAAAVADVLAKPATAKFRHIFAGYKIQDLRKAIDFEFPWPQNTQQSLAYLLDKFKQKLAERGMGDFYFEFQDCFGILDCTVTEVNGPYEWRQASERTPTKYGSEESRTSRGKIFDQIIECASQYKDTAKRIVVRTNINDPTTPLKSNHKYAVQLYWWDATYFDQDNNPDTGISGRLGGYETYEFSGEGWTDPKCASTWWTCAACVEVVRDANSQITSCYIGERYETTSPIGFKDCTLDAHGTPWWGDIRKVLKFEDLTIVFIDLGEENGGTSQ